MKLTNTFQFLFIDVLLILPIAIFSKSTPRYETNNDMASSNLVYSGLVGAIPGIKQETTNGRLGFEESPHTTAGSDGDLHSHPGGRMVDRAGAGLVRTTSLDDAGSSPTNANCAPGIYRRTSTRTSPTLRIRRTRHYS